MAQRHIPKPALDIFEKGGSPEDVVRAGVNGYSGRVVSARTARRWKLFWKQKDFVAIAAINKVNAHPEDQIKEGLLFDKEKLEVSEGSEWASASSVSDTICTLDELLLACKIDLKLWRVDRYEIKTYQGYRKDEQKDLQFDEGRITGTILDAGQLTLTTLYAVKAWLVRREEYPFEAALDKLLDRVSAAPKAKGVTRKPSKGEYLFIPALFDVHFGRRSVDGKYTVEKTSHEFGLAGEALIARALGMGMTIDRVMLPVGNDAMNADNLQGTTTRGTWQEMAADQRDIVDATCQSYMSLIEGLLEIAPVDVVVVESNHDRYSTYWLGKYLEAVFSKHRDAKHVTIDNARRPRKYYEYGSNLIGLEHGDRVKAKDLAIIMANEAAEIWGRTRYRTFFRGHFHKEYGMYAPAGEHPGVSVLTFPAFCPLDQWEMLMGFVGDRRRAEGRFYHRQNGPAGVFPVFVDELFRTGDDGGKSTAG